MLCYVLTGLVKNKNNLFIYLFILFIYIHVQYVVPLFYCSRFFAYCTSFFQWLAWIRGEGELGLLNQKLRIHIVCCEGNKWWADPPFPVLKIFCVSLFNISNPEEI
jgi:hypothetical protein